MQKYMKSQIRISVFETNSSSTHSICIKKDVSDYPDHVHFGRGEFGWEPEAYNDMWTKAEYLHEAILDNVDSKVQYERIKSKIEEILSNKNITCTWDDRLEWNTYKDGTEYECSFKGYIDHGRELNDWIEDLLNNFDLLYSFLFSDNSWVITGNDNGYEGDNMGEFPDTEFDYMFDKGN